jgi:nicotinate-nucleotide--dimethylbenzimidazole phosphoribosyltransferase
MAGNKRQPAAMNPTLSSADGLDGLRRLLVDLPAADAAAMSAVAAREARLTKPPGSLGRLEDLSRWLAGWQGRHPPRLERVAARVFAGNHGVAARGVSPYPAAVTAQMVANFEAGGGAVNQLCRVFGVDLDVVALDLDTPTADIVEAPAMDEAAFLAAFQSGMAAVDDGIDLLCLGEMGIGNTTVAAALACALLGGEAAAWTGPGTGATGEALLAKIAVVEAAVRRHRGVATDALDLARRLGGRELAALAGAVLAARLKRVPVLLDGFICTAAAAPLEMVRPGALDHCLIGHVSAEPGHRRLAERLGKAPLLDLDMRLGEGSGAVLAVAVARAAVACHVGMATFGEAGVSGRADGDGG